MSGYFKNKCRLFAVDMDGTLMTNRNSISDETKKALAAAKEAGIYILPITGRAYDDARKALDLIPGHESYVVTVGGSEIWKYPENVCLHKSQLNRRDIAAIYNTALRYGGWTMAFRSSGQYYVSRKHSYSDAFAAQYIKEPEYFDLNDFPLDDVSKCMIITKEDNRELLLTKLRDELPQYRFEAVWPSLIDAYTPGTDKGTKMLEIADLLGIDSGDIACIGDEGVDLPMFEKAALSIAMGNAADAVKQKADMVTDTNMNDGVAKAIYKYLL